MANDNSFQRRADKGGEIGPNGEHYRGGQFIATTKDRPKGGNLAWDARPKSPEALALDAEIAARIAREQAWLAARVESFAAVLAVLESEPQGVFETFWQSLARQLKDYGSLSPKQARHAVTAVLGRENKRNSDEWNELYEKLVERIEGGR